MLTPSMIVEQAELQMWLRLSLTPQIGLRRLLKILSRYSLQELTVFQYDEWRQLGCSERQVEYLIHASYQAAERCLEWCHQADNRSIIPYLDPRYPSLLREISSAPCTLFTAGEASYLNQPQIAIVGSRNASRIGHQTAHQFATELSRSGMVITSGLALGIDGQAHDGALNAGQTTIAVLAAGLRHLYPKRHIALAKRIEEHGVLVTEFVPDEKARAEYFPRRNRIISGLSVGVLVVEAALKSGSLTTARYAAEQGREVFVIPGSIHQPNCRGSNDLIRQGATLVQTSEQILEDVGNLVSWSQQEQAELFPSINNKEELPFPELLANVGIEATPIDIIAERTHIPVHEAMIQLLELELSGHVESVSGGYILKGRG